MSCFICGRYNCGSIFHSAEEQAIFQPAFIAYQQYIDVRERCLLELLHQHQPEIQLTNQTTLEK